MVKKRIAAFLLALGITAVLLSTGAVSASAAGYRLPEDTPVHASAAILVSLGGNAANDVVLIVLWVLASIHDIRYVSVVVCFVAFLVNDIYG